LYIIAHKTDDSFLGALKTQETKQLKGLENLEKRLLKAQKRKLNDDERIRTLPKTSCSPIKVCRNARLIFSEFYLEYGENLILL
jgi:hypothetical protein